VRRVPAVTQGASSSAEELNLLPVIVKMTPPSSEPVVGETEARRREGGGGGGVHFHGHECVGTALAVYS
jgi:hypothetical protein